jgi:hypothetical protein
MSNYAKADTKAQWFADNYPGSRIYPNCGVLHTTEGNDWPGYDGGAVAPTYTSKPLISEKRLVWRAHFPDEMSARALVNAAGGVETNTANALQVELVGTCDYAHRERWGPGSPAATTSTGPPPPPGRCSSWQRSSLTATSDTASRSRARRTGSTTAPTPAAQGSPPRRTARTRTG